MKPGDLVRVKNRCDLLIPGALCDKIGIVAGGTRRYEPGKNPLVRVIIESRERLFDYCALDVVNESG